MKVSSTFSKVAGSRDSVPGRAPQSAELSLCLLKRRRGSKGEPSPGVPPFSLLFCVCADTLGGCRCLALPFDPISLVLAQRNGVEPPKKSAFLPRRLHHSRERSCLGRRYSSSPDLGRGLVLVGGFCVCADTLGGGRWPVLRFDPISLVLAQRNGVEPPKKSAFFTLAAPPFA